MKTLFSKVTILTEECMTLSKKITEEFGEVECALFC